MRAAGSTIELAVMSLKALKSTGLKSHLEREGGERRRRRRKRRVFGKSVSTGAR